MQGQGPTQREASLERENEFLKELVGDLAIVNYALKTCAFLSATAGSPATATAPAARGARPPAARGSRDAPA